ncbi:hypothetical protein IL306_010853 [Fusarium sp. DS 682]|nr:hypothetical protein IL306_010853 [Fusarium sp. DS 682]
MIVLHHYCRTEPATTITAEAEPTNLLINGNFDLGTVDPWLTTRGGETVERGSDQPYEGPAYGALAFGISDGQSYTNNVYQKIPTNLLKEVGYFFSARVRVDTATASINGDGCNSIGIGCYYGDPDRLEFVPGSLVSVAADGAVGQWAELLTICTPDENRLLEYEYLSAVVGFNCANAEANVDAAEFEEVNFD